MGYLDSNGLAYLWGKIKSALSGKQNKLTGTAGQVVGFGADGEAVAQDAVESVFEFAQSGGYEGTEAQLAENLSNGPWMKACMPLISFEDNKDFGAAIGSEDKVILLQNGVYWFYNNGVHTQVGVAGPTEASHAATKKYVDDAIAAAITRAIEEAY